MTPKNYCKYGLEEIRERAGEKQLARQVTTRSFLPSLGIFSLFFIFISSSGQPHDKIKIKIRGHTKRMSRSYQEQKWVDSQTHPYVQMNCKRRPEIAELH